MYANRDTAVPVVPQRGLAALPILALCCLLFILLLIAATIVLALIPIYTQTAVATRASSSSTRYGTISLSTSTLPDGNIDSTSQTNLGNAIATSQGLPSGSVTVKSGVVSSNGGRRKRRGLLARSERQTIKTLTFSYVYNLIICGGSCTSAVLIKVAITITQVSLTVGGVTVSFTNLTVTVSTTTITAGPTVSSTVSTGSTTSTSSTVATTTPLVG